MSTARKIGYARVSSDAQDTALQMAALNAVPCELIFEEKMSSVAKQRHALTACLKALQPGDVLYVWKVDRLGRSMLDTALIVRDLTERGIGFKSITQPIDTTDPMGKMMLNMLMMFAEFERDMIVARTKAGLEVARERGHWGGRRQALSGDVLERAKAAYANRPIDIKTGKRMTVAQLAAEFGVNKRTLEIWVLHDGEQTAKLERTRQLAARAKRNDWYDRHPDVARAPQHAR